MWVFCASCSFPPCPKAVHMRWMLCLPCLRPVSVGVSDPVMKGHPVQGGSCLVPWAAGTDSGHPQPWTGISKWENHYFTCFYSSFLCSFSFFLFIYLFLFIFYCCSSTVVSIFSPSLSPTPVTLTSHPHSFPPLALSMGPLYMFLDDPSHFYHNYPLPHPLWLLSVLYLNRDTIIFILIL